MKDVTKPKLPKTPKKDPSEAAAQDLALLNKVKPLPKNAITVHVYFSQPQSKTAQRLKLSHRIPTGYTFDWIPLVVSPFGEFGIDGPTGFQFRLKPTKAALDSIVPVILTTFKQATSRNLSLTIIFNESNKEMVQNVKAWKSKLGDVRFL